MPEPFVVSPAVGGTEPTILHVDIDAFFAQVEQVLNPKLRGKPVAVGGYPGERGVVACPSYEARKLGLKTAMPLSQAYRIAPQTIFIKGEYAVYQQFSQRFYEILLHFTPKVEMLSQDEAAADVGGSLRRFGTTRKLAETLKQEIKQELGLTTSVGAATNRYLAKIACEFEKPDGLTIVMPGEEENFLRPLSVEVIPGVGSRTQAALGRLGIHTIGDLLRIPPKSLERLFGKRGREIAAIASPGNRPHYGVDFDIEPEEEQKSISRSTSFLANSSDPTFLLATLYYLLERACLALRRLGKLAWTVSVTLRFADYTFNHQAKRLSRPLSAEALIFPEVKQIFQTLYSGSQPLSLVGVGLTNLIPCARQLSLFSDPACGEQGRTTERVLRLTHALDAVRTRFGYHTLISGRTFPLRKTYSESSRGFILRTPSLSR